MKVLDATEKCCEIGNSTNSVSHFCLHIHMMELNNDVSNRNTFKHNQKLWECINIEHTSRERTVREKRQALNHDGPEFLLYTYPLEAGCGKRMK